MIFLPGTDKQIEILFKTLTQQFSSILIIGAGCEEIAGGLAANYLSTVTIIVDNYDTLLSTRLQLTKDKNTSVKMMEFSNTDFQNSSFDLIYAQASISNRDRNKIVKEIKRIIKPDGYFCIGENVELAKSSPQFIKDIWSVSEIQPLYSGGLKKYYEERNFRVISEHDLSYTLKDFYISSKNLLKEKSVGLTEQEKSYYKKLLKQISHESNAYLNLGGDKYMGFKMLILKKGSE